VTRMTPAWCSERQQKRSGIVGSVKLWCAHPERQHTPQQLRGPGARCSAAAVTGSLQWQWRP
jgi:hypothetical protein